MMFFQEEKLGGRSIPSSDLIKNGDMLNGLEIFDVKWCEASYTWSNSKHGVNGTEFWQTKNG